MQITINSPQTYCKTSWDSQDSRTLLWPIPPRGNMCAQLGISRDQYDHRVSLTTFMPSRPNTMGIVFDNSGNSSDHGVSSSVCLSRRGMKAQPSCPNPIDRGKQLIQNLISTTILDQVQVSVTMLDSSYFFCSPRPRWPTYSIISGIRSLQSAQKIPSGY